MRLVSSSLRPPTARARLVSALTEEILQSTEQAAFPLASEHQLCRQYKISRVTVRLALSDLENRGLIYRRHGKGTFAHGRGSRVHRNLGLLLKSPHVAEHRPIAEFARGLQTILAPLRAGLLIMSTPPDEWRPEMASSLGGVVVQPEDVTAEELDVIKTRKIPFYILGESNLPGPSIQMGEPCVARKMTEDLLQLGHRRFALFSGFDTSMDAAKRKGIYEAFIAAGIDPAQVPEVSSHGKEGEVFRAAGEILKLDPRPTAVIAFDDSLGALLSGYARRYAGLKVPTDLSIVSFHQWPLLSFVEPTLTTVHFDFFNAGQRAAEALNQAALTGNQLEDIVFDPQYITGHTTGAAPVA